MKDAIIVLGRNIYPDGSLPPDAISRVKKAVELYKRHEAPIIIMSGKYSHRTAQEPRVSEAYAMKEFAIDLGVPTSAIIEESHSTHTLANAYFTKKLICEPQGWTDLILVASDEHMPRAEFLFKKTFGDSYRFTAVLSERVLTDAEYTAENTHEAMSMKLAQQYMSSITNGDDEAIRRMVLLNNPSDTMGQTL